MPRECRLEVRDVAISRRVKNDSIERFKLDEEKKFRQLIKKGARVVALDAGGTMFSTEQLASRLQLWMNDYGHVQMLIGGPNGLSDGARSMASEVWSLSRLTFPHFLVRILVAEQMYRAWSLLNNHPYHK